MGADQSQIGWLAERINCLQADLANALARLAALEQQGWQTVGSPFGAGGGGGRWVKLGASTLGPAVPPAYVNGAANFATDSGSSPLTDSGQAVPGGVNWSFNKTIAAGAYCYAVPAADTGIWWVVLVDCGSLS